MIHVSRLMSHEFESYPICREMVRMTEGDVDVVIAHYDTSHVLYTNESCLMSHISLSHDSQAGEW